MKLLFVSHDNYGYGATQSLFTLIQGIRKEAPATEISVLLPGEGFLSTKLKGMAISVYPCQIPRWFLKKKDLTFRARIRTVYRSLTEAFRLRKLFSEGKRPDFIISNTSVSGLGLLLSLLLRCRHIFYIREFALLDYQLYPVLGTFQMIAGCRLSTGVITNSVTLKAYVADVYACSKAVSIYNGFSVGDYKFLTKSVRTENIRFAVIATFSSGKGHDFAFNAFARFLKIFPDALLYLAGDGDHTLITSHPLWQEISKSVVMPGFVSRMQDFLAEIDVVIVASESEAFGRVTVESMLCGCPVLGRNTGGTSELIRHGETGLLFNTEDELVNAMILLAENPGLRKSLSENANTYARTTFTIEQYTTQFMTFLNQRKQN